MTISSRTPEGDPNDCPICGHELRLEPSIDTRDGPCPCCGHLLWFPEATKCRRSARRGSFEALLMRKGKERLGPFPLELQLRLIRAIPALVAKKELPGSAELEWLVSAAASWRELVALLEERGRPAGAETPRRAGPARVVRTAGRAIVARVKRLFAGADSSGSSEA